MQIEIKPLDTVFFRDGKPFSMGEESWANGMFPPNPSVFAGMLRTIYMTEEKKTAVEVWTDTKHLTIKNIHLKLDDDLLFPIPSDVVFIKEDDDFQPLFLDKNDNISSHKLPGILTNNRNKKASNESGKAFIYSDVLESYLRNGRIEYPKFLKDIISVENKIGIGRDRQTHITQESMLYRVNMIRTEPIYKTMPRDPSSNQLKFVVTYDNFPSLSSKGICTLGAEGKKAEYQISNNSDELISLPSIESNLIKIYLATPAIFNSGNIPGRFLSKTYDLTSGKAINMELVAAAIGKTSFIGGFDMANRIPKPMYKAVPAGSVFYLKTDTQEEALSLAKAIHGQQISDISPELGYGLCYVGNVKFIN